MRRNFLNNVEGKQETIPIAPCQNTPPFKDEINNYPPLGELNQGQDDVQTQNQTQVQVQVQTQENKQENKQIKVQTQILEEDKTSREKKNSKKRGKKSQTPDYNDYQIQIEKLEIILKQKEDERREIEKLLTKQLESVMKPAIFNVENDSSAETLFLDSTEDESVLDPKTAPTASSLTPALEPTPTPIIIQVLNVSRNTLTRRDVKQSLFGEDLMEDLDDYDDETEHEIPITYSDEDFDECLSDVSGFEENQGDIRRNIERHKNQIFDFKIPPKGEQKELKPTFQTNKRTPEPKHSHKPEQRKNQKPLRDSDSSDNDLESADSLVTTPIIPAEARRRYPGSPNATTEQNQERIRRMYSDADLCQFLRSKVPISSGHPTERSEEETEVDEKPEPETNRSGNKRAKKKNSLAQETKKPCSSQTSLSDRVCSFYQTFCQNIINLKTGFLNIDWAGLQKVLNGRIFYLNLIFMIFMFFLIGRVSSFSDNFLTVVLATFTFFSLFLLKEIRSDYHVMRRKKTMKKQDIGAFIRKPKKPPDDDQSSNNSTRSSYFFKGFEDDISSVIPEAPRKGIKNLTPPGSVSRTVKSRKFKKEPIKISEARVDLIDERPHIQITLPDNVPRMALFDTGATSCSISREVLKQVEKYVPIPRASNNGDFTLQGVIPGATIPITDIVYMTFALQNGHLIRNVPMVVIDQGTDLILGANLVRTYKWASYWNEGKYFIDIGHDLKPVHATFMQTSEVTGVSIEEIKLEPGQSRIIDLKIPLLQGLRETCFHRQNLLIEPLEGKKSAEPGVEAVIAVSKLKKGRIKAMIRNKSKHPMEFNEPTVFAKITVIPGPLENNKNITDITRFRQNNIIFNQIPRVDPSLCYCEIIREPNHVLIQFSDQYGFTNTIRNLVTSCPSTQMRGDNPGPVKRFSPRFIIQNEEDPLTREKRFGVFIIPKEDGTFSDITPNHIQDMRRTIITRLREASISKSPQFFVTDPLVDMSIETRDFLVDLYKELGFHFAAIKPRDDPHSKCVHFTKQQFPPEIIAGTQVTKLHIHQTNGPIPDEHRIKTKGTPVFKTSIMGATLFIFRMGIFLMCQLHMPADLSNGIASDGWRDRLFHSLFSELRQLRSPLDFEITTDHYYGEPFSKQIHLDILRNTLRKIPSFLPPNDRCMFPLPLTSEEEIKTTDPFCPCLSCCTACNGQCTTKPDIHEIYRGNINNLVNVHFKPSRVQINATNISVSTFTAVQASEFDTPLDPLGLVDDDEMDAFINSYPGLEDEYLEELRGKTLKPQSGKSETQTKLENGSDETDPPRPPPTKSSIPNPPIGIPDHYQRGEWRDFLDLSKIDIPQEYKDRLANLMDKVGDVFSCFATDSRPILVDGEPAVVDIELTTTKPIFIKPYVLSPKMSEVLDAKIDELLEKDEIIEIDSPYNIPLLLTHHNSENKHVEFDKRKFRLCLDMRPVNSVTRVRNKHSFLVKGIEFTYARVKGMKYFTKIDMRKAYRSMVASERLRRICAFRTPSSAKRPFETFAFRSTPDGLACLPGTYSYFILRALSPRSRKACIQHIDDLLIASPDLETHLADIESVLTDLLKSNFMVSIAKFEPFQTKVTFLGHILDGETLQIPEDRKTYFDSLAPPTTRKELQSLLGVSGYMAQFVDSYHLKVGPLFDALKGKTDKQTFTLDAIQMKAFEELKQSIKAAEHLHIVDFDKPIYMEVDSSLTGTGSILYQEFDNPANPEKPLRRIVRYGSKRFSVTESLHHTSLEREALGVLIGARTHYYYLFNCPRAIIKTDLKSLITLLSCYNNPDSTRMARISHKLYSLPFQWSLIHSAGVDIPIADALSRLYPPYKSAFTDRHLRYPDLKRDNIKLPDEWKKTPNLVLTTADVLQAMHDQIVFVEKSSLNVKNKRLRSLINELSILHDEMEGRTDSLTQTISEELQRLEATAKTLKEDQAAAKDLLKPAKEVKQRKTRKKPDLAGTDEDENQKDELDGLDEDDKEEMSVISDNYNIHISALTAVSPRALITPQFIAKYQREDEKINAIIMHLKTKEKPKKKLISKYRLLNDSILITRKNKNLPFHAPGNLRIASNDKMSLVILALLHIMGGHIGLNSLARMFGLSYKPTEGSILSFAKMVALGCKSCRLHRPVNKRNIPPGRIPIPSEPMHTFHLDHVVFSKDINPGGKKIEAALNIVDLYSNMLFSFLVPDQTVRTTIKKLKTLFSMMPAPYKVVSDNATALCGNKKIREFLRSKGVVVITTTTPYNSRADKTERMNKAQRDAMNLVRETFKRKSLLEVHEIVTEMLNSKPSTYPLRPDIKKALGGKDEIVTPFSLHYGKKPNMQPLLNLEDELEVEERVKYQQRWRKILQDHDKFLQDELDERNQPFHDRGDHLEKGDLVLMKNHRAHKEKLKYYRNLYEITDIQKARYICTPLFGGSPLVQANGNDLKPYNYAELLDLLPDNIKTLMGDNMSPEELKKSRTSVLKDIPKDFQEWGLLELPASMKLRNRISPASLLSLPALSVPDSSISKFSHSTHTITTISSSSGRPPRSDSSSDPPGSSGPGTGYPLVRDPSRPLNIAPPFDNKGKPLQYHVDRTPFAGSVLGDRASLSLPTSLPSIPGVPANSIASSFSSHEQEQVLSSPDEAMNLQTDGTGKIVEVPRKIQYLPRPPIPIAPLQKLRNELDKKIEAIMKTNIKKAREVRKSHKRDHPRADIPSNGPDRTPVLTTIPIPKHPFRPVASRPIQTLPLDLPSLSTTHDNQVIPRTSQDEIDAAQIEPFTFITPADEISSENESVARHPEPFAEIEDEFDLVPPSLDSTLSAVIPEQPKDKIQKQIQQPAITEDIDAIQLAPVEEPVAIRPSRFQEKDDSPDNEVSDSGSSPPDVTQPRRITAMVHHDASPPLSPPASLESDSVDSILGATHVPVPPPSPRPFVAFSDQKGLPLCEDNDGQKWKLSKKFIKDPSATVARKHIPFDEAAQSTNSSSLSSATIPPLQQPLPLLKKLVDSTEEIETLRQQLQGLKEIQDSVKEVKETRKHSKPSHSQTQQITRRGRIIRPPVRFGFETDTSEPVTKTKPGQPPASKSDIDESRQNEHDSLSSEEVIPAAFLPSADQTVKKKIIPLTVPEETSSSSDDERKEPGKTPTPLRRKIVPLPLPSSNDTSFTKQSDTSDDSDNDPRPSRISKLLEKQAVINQPPADVKKPVIPSLDSTMDSLPPTSPVRPSSPTLDLIRRIQRNAFRYQPVPLPNVGPPDVPMDFYSPVRTPVEMQSPVKTPVDMQSVPTSPQEIIMKSPEQSEQPMNVSSCPSPLPPTPVRMTTPVSKSPATPPLQVVQPATQPSRPLLQPAPQPTLRLRPKPPPSLSMPIQNLFPESPLTGKNDLYSRPVPTQSSISSNPPSDVSILRRPSGLKQQVLPLPPAFVQISQPVDTSDIPPELRREQSIRPILPDSPVIRGLPLPDFTLGRDVIRQNQDSDFSIPGITPLTHQRQPVSLSSNASQRRRDIDDIVDSLSNIKQATSRRKIDFTKSPTFEIPKPRFTLPSPLKPERIDTATRDSLIPYLSERLPQVPVPPPVQRSDSWTRQPSRTGKHTFPSPDQFHINQRQNDLMQHRTKRHDSKQTPSSMTRHPERPTFRSERSSLLRQELNDTSGWDVNFDDDSQPVGLHSLHEGTSADTIILPLSPVTPHTSLKTTLDSTFDQTTMDGLQPPRDQLSHSNPIGSDLLNRRAETENDDTTRYESYMQPGYEGPALPATVAPTNYQNTSFLDDSARLWPTTPSRNAQSTFNDGKSFVAFQPPSSPFPPNPSKTQVDMPSAPATPLRLKQPSTSTPSFRESRNNDYSTHLDRTLVQNDLTSRSLDVSGCLEQDTSGPSQIGPTPDVTLINPSRRSQQTIIKNQDSLHVTPPRFPEGSPTPIFIGQSPATSSPRTPVSQILSSPATPRSRSPLRRIDSTRSHVSETPDSTRQNMTSNVMSPNQSSLNENMPQSPFNDLQQTVIHNQSGTMPTDLSPPRPDKPDKNLSPRPPADEVNRNEMNEDGDPPVRPDHSPRLDHPAPQNQHQDDQTSDEVLSEPARKTPQKKVYRKRVKPSTPQEPPRRSTRTSVPPTRLTYNEDFSQGSSQSSLPPGAQDQGPQPSTSRTQMPPPRHQTRPRPRRSPKRTKKYETD